MSTPPTPPPSSSAGASAAATPAAVVTPSSKTATPTATPGKRQKRRRTRSHNSSPSPGGGQGFFVPGFDPAAGSSKMMSLSDVMDAAKGITNMYLAHEIAVDKDFMLQDLKGPQNPIEAQVRQVVHRAFWDLLKEQLEEDPPNYTQALVLLKEVKEGLLGLLVPQQRRLIQSIQEKLDLELIGQQAENGALDFQAYADYVLNLMAQLCAPVRDEEIAKLRTETGVVPLFKGILGTLDHMRLDMANFTLQQARPLIVSQSVEYERTKFKDFLATQTDGLRYTREWLQRHASAGENAPENADSSRSGDARFQRLLVQRVVTDAYLELLEWDEFHPLPETLVMDAKRIVSVRDSAERAAVSTAVILLAFSNVSGFVVPQDAQKLKETVKKHVDVLLEEFMDDADLLRILPNVALQVVKDVDEYLSSKSKASLPESVSKTLQDQIVEMEDPNHRIRDLVQRRIVDFCKQAVSASRAAPLTVPPGLTLCQKDLAHIAGNFVRLVNYNRSVFGEFYTDIVENHVLFKADGASSVASASSTTSSSEDKREA